MKFVAILFLFGLIVSGVAPGWAAEKGAKPRVALKVIADPKGPVGGQQDWLRVLSEVGFSSLAIESSSDRVQAEIEKQGSAASPTYAVTAFLSVDNVLHLPGQKQFTLHDKASIKQWLATLSDSGVEGVTEKRVAFGLVPAQLETVKNDLKRPIESSTDNTPVLELMDTIGRRLKYQIVADPSVARDLSQAKIISELRDVATGTALAIALGQSGFGFAPERLTGGLPRYRVFALNSGRESWPSGVVSDKPERELMPALFEVINVDVDKTPLSETLSVLEDRLHARHVFDWPGLARRKIDPAAINVSVPAGKMSYSMMQTKVLSQAKLRVEMRVDDAGQPFFWVSPAGGSK